jgi:hypothetical protein
MIQTDMTTGSEIPAQLLRFLVASERAWVSRDGLSEVWAYLKHPLQKRSSTRDRVTFTRPSPSRSPKE